MLKFSPSQLATFRRCKRMYVFQYNESLWPPPSKRQDFGTIVHKYLEEWLSKGIIPPRNAAGEVAKQGLRLLPSPKDGLETEKEWIIQWDPNFSVGGYIDVIVPPALVIDHKTTSDLKWAKKEIDLCTDEQALLYSLWAMLNFEVSQVTAKWVYYAATNPANGNRKPKGCKTTQTVFDANDSFFLSQIRVIDDDFRQMYDIRTKKALGKDMPASPESCQLYEGCWHLSQGRCSDLSNEDLFAALLTKHGK